MNTAAELARARDRYEALADELELQLGELRKERTRQLHHAELSAIVLILLRRAKPALDRKELTEMATAFQKFQRGDEVRHSNFLSLINTVAREKGWSEYKLD